MRVTINNMRLTSILVAALTCGSVLAKDVNMTGLSNATIKSSNGGENQRESPDKIKPTGSERSFLEKIYSSETKPADLIVDWDKEDWKDASLEDLQAVYNRYLEGMENLQGEALYRESEGYLISMIQKAFPKMESYWGEFVTFKSVPVIRSKEIIDRHRVEIEPFSLGAVQKDTGAFHSLDESNHADIPDARTSAERMRASLAPIGHDGRPIVLCRLHDDPRASYFEMNQKDAAKLLVIMGDKMNLGTACLTDGMIKGYWEDRLQTLK